MFLIRYADQCRVHDIQNCFNPLNQVYVFNGMIWVMMTIFLLSFNPLNQVYVFNAHYEKKKIFNGSEQVLIP